MTYEEMKAVADAVANALKGAPDIENVEGQPFEPGELPEIMLTVKGEDVFLTVGVL